MKKTYGFCIVVFIVIVVGFSSPYIAPSFNHTCPNNAQPYDSFDYFGTNTYRNTLAYVLMNGKITAKELLCVEVSNGSNQKAANAAVGDTYDMTFFFPTVPLHVKVYLLS